MSTRLSSWLQRTAALLILAAVTLAGIAATASPLFAAWQRREAALERRAEFEALLAQPAAAGVQYDPTELYALLSDEGAATIALQTTLDRIAREAGVALQSIRPIATEEVGASARSTWVEVQLMGDLEALTGLLAMLDAERPALLVRQLDITNGQGPRPDLFLQIRMEAGQAWRTAEGQAG
jgi:hypothetical protein